MKKVLFVCTGNTCRSVLAHYYAAKVAADAYRKYLSLFTNVKERRTIQLNRAEALYQSNDYLAAGRQYEEIAKEMEPKGVKVEFIDAPPADETPDRVGCRHGGSAELRDNHDTLPSAAISAALRLAPPEGPRKELSPGRAPGQSGSR